MENAFIEQIMNDDLNDLCLFNAKVVVWDDTLIKLMYKDETNKNSSLIVKKINVCEVEIGNIFNTNILHLDEVRDFHHVVEGYELKLQCELKKFIFTSSLVELEYNILDNNQIISKNHLKIYTKSKK